MPCYRSIGVVVAALLPASAQAPSFGVAVALVRPNGEATTPKPALALGLGLQARFPLGPQGALVLRVDHAKASGEANDVPAAPPRKTDLTHTSLGADYQWLLGTGGSARPYLSAGLGVLRRNDHTYLHTNYAYSDREAAVTRPFVALGIGCWMAGRWDVSLRAQVFSTEDAPSGPGGTRTLVSLGAAFHF
jgi:hypothetical protein